MSGVSVAGQRLRRPVDRDSRFFAEGLADGRILIQRCAHCGVLRNPPRPMCPACRSLAWDTVTATGRGRIYSYAKSYQPKLPGLPSPNVVLLVELEEGVRMIGDLIGDGDDPALAIDAPVTAAIVADPGDAMLLVRWTIDAGRRG